MRTQVFPPGLLDPSLEAELASRADRLQAPPRSQVRLGSPGEWLCRIFCFPPDTASADIVISVGAASDVAATEARDIAPNGAGAVRRETRRLDPVQGAMFHDMVTRLDPWTRQDEAEPDTRPVFIMEFMEQGRYSCLVMDATPPGSLERQMAKAFLDLWPDRSTVALKHIT